MSLEEFNKPDFIIIGAMKSATSTLQEQLSCLPGVFTTNPKEPNFFSNDSIYENGLQWYSGLFARAGVSDIKGEASTHYTKLPRYPKTVYRLKEYAPDAKLIYIMRHPIDRLISHYIHNWSMGFVPRQKSLEEALEEYENFVSYSLYAMQLAPWLEAYGKSKILPVFFDRILRYPGQELERICKFIDYPGPVKWSENISPSNVSSERLRKFPFYDFVVRSPAMSWVRQRFVPQYLRESIKSRLRLQTRPQLSEEYRAKLVRIFNEDLSILGGLLGVKLNCENFRELTAKQELDWISRQD